jgi:hypothetical protein
MGSITSRKTWPPKNREPRLRWRTRIINGKKVLVRCDATPEKRAKEGEGT